MGNNMYNLPRFVDDPEIISIAKDLDKEPRRVSVSWSAQRGSSLLPMSVTPEHITSNFEVFELPQAHFDRIKKLDRHHRYNFPASVGVDIFEKVDQATIRKKVEEWKAHQRQQKAACYAEAIKK